MDNIVYNRNLAQLDRLERQYDANRDLHSDGVRVSSTEIALIEMVRDLLREMALLQAQVDRLEIAVDRIEDAVNR